MGKRVGFGFGSFFHKKNLPPQRGEIFFPTPLVGRGGGGGTYFGVDKKNFLREFPPRVWWGFIVFPLGLKKCPFFFNLLFTHDFYPERWGGPVRGTKPLKIGGVGGDPEEMGGKRKKIYPIFLLNLFLFSPFWLNWGITGGERGGGAFLGGGGLGGLVAFWEGVPHL